MNFLKSIGLAISMYTKIPMPKLEMNNATLKYCLYFLPLTGLIVGITEVAWLIISVTLGFSPVLFGAGACAVPFFVTGGIHLDGYLDTSDALNSHAEVKKKHYILNDPHVGAFSVISSIIYILMMFAVLYEIYSMIGGLQGLWIIGADGPGEPADRLRDFAVYLLVIFIASRALTALSAASIRTSKKEGMLYTFVIFTNRKYLALVSLIVIILCCAAAIKMFGWSGFAFPAGIFVVYLYFRIMAIHQFGGISGDLCGWLIQVTELLLLIIFLFLFR